MNREPLKVQVFMGIAEALSLLGTCDRKHVGAVFVKDGRCITWGYNGAPPGQPHCNENNHGWPEDVFVHSEAGCVNATHAEANALAFAARHGISTDGTTLFVTVSPCLDCSRLLIAAGVRAVYYKEEYRDGSGLELLRAADIWCGAL